MKQLSPTLYRLLRRHRDQVLRAPSTTRAVVVMVAIALGITSLAVVHVSKEQEKKRLGYELSRMQARAHTQRELGRRLDLELAVLSAPNRIRAIATRLGMVPTPPDRIRVVDAPPSSQPAALSHAGAPQPTYAMRRGSPDATP